jgi:hypothetical protein
LCFAVVDEADSVWAGPVSACNQGECSCAYPFPSSCSRSLRAQTAAIGALEADLRRAHLAAHLEMRTLLTAEQVAAYDRLRGYGAAQGGAGAHGGSHGHGQMRH